MDDADRTITFNGNPTLADWFDQSVKTTADVEFNNIQLSAADVTASANASSFESAVDSLTAGAKTITLLTDDANQQGTLKAIKDFAGSAYSNTISVVGQGGQTIDGESSVSIKPYEGILVCANPDGNFDVIASHQSHRWMLVGLSTNTPASSTVYCSLFSASGHPSEYYSMYSGWIPTLQVVIDDDDIAGWTAGTVDFHIYKNGSSAYSTGTYDKAGFAAAASGTRANTIRVFPKISYSENDDISSVIVTGKPFL